MLRFVRRVASWGVVAAVLVLPASSAHAGGSIAETEPNNSFGDAQLIPNQIRTVTGGIASFLDEVNFEFSRTLAAGDHLDFLREGESAGAPFIAWIDNDFDSQPDPDTLLGSFDSPTDPTPITDDNASPEGTGTASALQGEVNGDGTIRLSVTGAGDGGFVGSHSQTGEFDLFVHLGELDLDFFYFPGLPVGADFTMTLDVTDANKTLLWLDNVTGMPINAVHDQFPIFIEGNVPSSGELNFAVTGGSDLDADGVPDGTDTRIGIGTGEYTLKLVPEPDRVPLALTALIVLVSLARRRGAARARP